MNTNPEDRLHDVLARLFRVGVILAAACLLAGGTAYLIRHGQDPVEDRTTFRPEPPEFSQAVVIAGAALEGSGRALVQLALMGLLLLPVVGAAVCVVGFARLRDRLYTILAVVVFALLALGVSGLLTLR